MGWAEPCGRVCEPLEIGSRALFPGNGCPGGPGGRDTGCQRSMSQGRTVNGTQHKSKWHRYDQNMVRIPTEDAGSIVHDN